MGNNRKFTKDLSMVVISNCIVLFGSILTGFIIPKLLGVTEYGYYKTFTLYLGYASLLHLGYVDGVLLKFAGKEFSELNEKNFRRYTKFFLIFQIVVGLLIIAISVVFISKDLKYVFVLLGIDVFSVNVTAYYQYVSQSTMRFKELSLRKILLASLKIFLVALIFCLYRIKLIDIVTANTYVTGLVLIDLVLTIWYIVTYRSITFGATSPFAQCIPDIKGFFKNGIILTVSFQAAHIIFSLDRQFVSILFDTKTYGVYSFAYNLISMVNTVVGAVSLVLFPRLRQLEKENVIKTFSTGMASISIVSFAVLIGFQPLCLIIRWFLPEYGHSLDYLIIIFPGLALSSCISIIMFTYYKALDAQLVYFKVCCLVMIIAASLNYSVYKLFGTPESISIVSIVTLLIWYIYCELYFIRVHGVKWKKNFLYTILCMSVFYLCNSSVKSFCLNWIIYTSFFIALTYGLYKNEVISIVKRFIKHN